MESFYVFPIFLLLLFLIISTKLNTFDFYKNLTVLRKFLVSFVFALIFYGLFKYLYNHVIFYLRNNFLETGLLKIFITFVLSFACLYLAFVFLGTISTVHYKQNKIANLNNSIELKNSIIAKLRCQKHDYLKHLQIVYSLLNTGLNNDAKEYITNISNSFRTKTSRYGKVSYLDAIASLKYEECLMKNIKFDVYIQDFIDNLIINPKEMSSVLLNIIDNAIDSLSSISKDNKYIKLTIYEDEFQYVISIKNNGPKIYNTKDIFNEGFSTKNGQDRGYGLFLVKEILDKYNYYIFVDSDDFLTEFTILIPKYI